MNSKTYLIIFLSFFIFSCQSNNVVYEASGDFITSEKEVVGSIEIMEQGPGSNLRINLTKFIPGLHYLKINNFGTCVHPNFQNSGEFISVNPDINYIYKFYLKNEISRYTGKLKVFNKIIFVNDIFLNPDNPTSLIDNDMSSIMIFNEKSEVYACAELKL